MRLFTALRERRPSLAACLLALRSKAARGQIRMSSSLPVAAVCQMTATPDKEANFSACTRLVEQAKEGGASMVFLPEGFDYIGSNREETLALSETLDGDIITRYTHLARKLDVWLSLGGFHERGHDWKTDRRIYNSHIIINGQGEIVSVYRKGHLFDVELTSKGVSLKESAFTVPGPRLLPPVQTPIGKVLLRARAIETQCFVLAAAQVGAHHAKRTSYGHALAVDPWGVVIGDCGGSDVGVTLIQIDLQALQDVRRDMPVQQHRREKDFYCSLD
ncbi:deaminated glutathione amidase isoform X3 [Megalobrama amblycephala]|uniref:deaminated glutathione amidase isoform X3 n=1 Tax=Megalobrama amblycephala TaxID=75352 RepID=UPI002013F902|nr:deaminated glutathione amidase isoform X3 [Megalobrama amblycephala]